MCEGAVLNERAVETGMSVMGAYGVIDWDPPTFSIFTSFFPKSPEPFGKLMV